MNIWKALTVLNTIGTALTVIGRILKSLGESITGPNLGSGTTPPVADESSPRESMGLGSEDIAMLQDPPPQGGMDEKPDEVQEEFLFVGGGSTEPPSQS